MLTTQIVLASLRAAQRFETLIFFVGPLVQFIENKATLVGLVSFGYECASGYPGVYTNIATYRNWIQSLITE